MPPATVLDRTTASPPPLLPEDAADPGERRTVLTGRGVAAARLSEFQDQWAELTAEDRAWFAHWLNELLIDAVLPETAPSA